MAEKSAEMAKASTEMEARVAMPPEDLRCRRNDGKSWQCSGWRSQGKNLCEKHYMQSMATSAKTKSLSSSVGSQGKAKDFQESKGRGGGDGDAGGLRRLGLGSGSSSQKRRRDDEESSEEEMLTTKKIRRNVGVKGRKRKFIIESDGEEEEEERSGIKKPKVEVKKPERGCKREAGNENEVVSVGRTQKKKAKKEHVSEADCQMCHQCMAGNKKVVKCRKERALPKGCRRSYCEDCLEKW